MKTIYTRFSIALFVFVTLLMQFNLVQAQEKKVLTLKLNNKVAPVPNDTMCLNSSFSLQATINGGPAPVHYPSPRWSGSAAAFITSYPLAPLDSNLVIFTFTTSGPFTIRFTVHDASNVVYFIEETIVVDIEQPLFIVSPPGGTSSICLGDSINLISSGATEYLWYKDDCAGGGYDPLPFASGASVYVTPTGATCKYIVYGYGPLGCPTNPEYQEYTINTISPPSVNAGPDQTVCAQTPVLLSGTIGGSATSATWSTSGTGTFTPNNTTLNATYNPSAADVSAGTVTLTLTTNDPPGPCSSANDQMTITFNALATANAGADRTVCGQTNVVLAGSISGSATSATWSTSGTGTFTPDNTTLNATYNPSIADVAAGSVILTLTTNDPAGPCPAGTDQMTITFNPPAIVNAGPDQTVCGQAPVLLAGSIAGSASSATWSTSGSGTFTPNNTTLNATYNPSAADVAAGSVNLTLTSNNPAGPCPAVTDQMTIIFNSPALVNAGVDQTVCGQTPVTLNGTIGGSATSGTWTSSGTGTFAPNNTTLNATYTPSAADVTAGSVILTLTSNDPVGPCPTVSDQMTIFINTPAIVNAGPDQSICGQTPVTLNGTIGGSATSATWTTSGTGTFAPNNTTLNATYTPSAADVLAGSVTLTLTTNDPAGPCLAVTDQMTIFINSPALVNAGVDRTVCGQTPVVLAGTIGGSATSATWTTSGTGTFTPNNTTLTATYNPSVADAAAGSVILTLTTNDPVGPCPAVSDQMTIFMNTPAIVNAGPDQTVCGQTPVSLAGSIGGSATSAVWTTSGTGTFSPNNTTLNATYNPSATDVTAGSVILTLRTNNPVGPCPAVTDQMTITFNQATMANAGPDQSICGQVPVVLNGTIGGGATSATWTTSGSGTFTPNNTTLNATYNPSAADVTAGSVILTLTTNDPVGPCTAASDQMTIFISTPAIVNAGPDQTVCAQTPVILAGVIGGSATSATWTTSGTGTFTPNNTTLNATYNPSAADVVIGLVTLTLTTNDPPGICPVVSDQMTITLNQGALVNAGPDQSICGQVPVILNGTIGGSATSATWTTSGTGTFTPNNTTLNATYNPSVADVAAGSVVLTLTTNDPAGPCLAASDQMTIFIGTPAMVNAGPDQTVCGQTAVSLNGTIGGSAVSVTWTTSGTGTFTPNNTSLNATYNPSINDVAAGFVTLTLTTNDPPGICPAVTDQMTITFNQAALVNAGPDQSICGQIPVILAGTIGGGAISATWTTTGTGTFTPDNTTLNATYNPSAADVIAGSVILTLTTNDPAGPCPAATDQMTIFIGTPAIVDAGPDQTVCAQTPVILAGIIGGSATSATWSTSGTGTFAPNNITLNATYNPSLADVAAGMVTLTLTTNDPAGICPAVSDQMTIFLNQAVIVDAGPDQSICGPVPVTLNGTIGGSATSATWTTSGTGIFTPDNTTLNATYNPSAADVIAGSVILTLTTNDPTGPCPAGSDQMTITISTPATVDAGPDQTICDRTPIVLNGIIGGGATSATWTTSGTGIFTPNNTTLNATYTPSLADVAAGTVTLTLTTNAPGGCPPASDFLILRINGLIGNNIIAANQSYCSGTIPDLLTGTIPTGGNGVYTYQWQQSVAPFTLYNDIPGANGQNYQPGVLLVSTRFRRVVSSPPCANSISNSIIIQYNPSPIANAGVDDTICNPIHGESYFLNGSASGGSPGYSYSWSTVPASGWTSNLQSVEVFPTVTTTYQLIVGDQTPCYDTDWVVITVLPYTVVASAGGDYSTCTGNNGGAVTLHASGVGGVGPYTYMWGASPIYGWNPDPGQSYEQNPTVTPNKTTIFTVTVTDANGCWDTDQAIVTTYPMLYAEAGNDSTICASGGIVLGGNPPAWGGTPEPFTRTYNFLWSSSPFDPSLVGHTTEPKPFVTPTVCTSYYLLVTDFHGCTARDTVVICTSERPTAHAGNDTSICNGNNSGIVTLGATPAGTGGTPPYTYQWSGNPNYNWTSIGQSQEQNPSVLPTITTTFTLMVTDANGCTGTDDIIINVNPEIIANAGRDQTMCHPNNNDSVILGGNPTGSGGTPPLNYLWSSSPVDPTLTGHETESNPVVIPTIATTYTLIVNDASGMGCGDTDIVVINVAPEIFANAGPDKTLCGGGGGFIQIGGSPTGSGGTLPLHYLWNTIPPSLIWSSNNSNPTVSPTVTTIYEVSVIDSLLCYDKDTMVVFVDKVINVDAGQEEWICTDSAVWHTTLGGNPTASGGTKPYQFLWSSTSTGITIANVENPYVSIPVSETDVTFTVIVSDSLGCTAFGTKAIHFYSFFGAEAGENDTLCGPGQAQLNVITSGGVSPYVYSWTSKPIGFVSDIQNPIVTPTVTTTYYIDVWDHDSINACHASDSVIVFIDNQIVIDSIQIIDSLKSCQDSSGRVKVWASGGTAPLSYIWSTTPQQFTDTASNLTSGTYYVTVSSALGACQSVIGSVTLNDPTHPSGELFIDPNPVCMGDSVTFTVINTDIVHNTFLFRINGNIVQGPDHNYICITDTITQTSIISVLVTDTAGCDVTLIDTLNIGIFGVEAGNDTTLSCPPCKPIQIGYFGTPNCTYLWRLDPTGGYISDTTVSNPWVQPLITTIYHLFVTDTLTHCTAEDSVKYIVNQLPPIFVGNDETLCPGECDTIGPGFPAPTGCYFNWTSIPAGFNSNEANVVVCPYESRIYLFTMCDTVTNCISQGRVRIDVPYIYANAGDDTIICNGESVMIGDLPVTHYTYSWASLPDGFTSNISNPIVSPSITTTYILTVYDTISGCDLNDTVLVYVVIPPAYAGKDTSICFGDNITIGEDFPSMDLYDFFWYSIPGGWSSHDLVNIVYPMDSITTYVLTVTLKNSQCYSEDRVDIATRPTPSIVLVSDKQGDIIYSGQVITFTAYPENYTEYDFFIDGELVQKGPSNIFKTDKITNDTTIVSCIAVNNDCESWPYPIMVIIKSIPNAFTPNGDGINDIFLEGMDLTIINRWGQTMFEGTKGWDGRYNGQKVSPGTYYYIVRIKDMKKVTTVLKGAVTIIDIKQ